MIFVVSLSRRRGWRIASRLARRGHHVEGPFASPRDLFDFMEGNVLPTAVVVDASVSAPDVRRISRTLATLRIPVRLPRRHAGASVADERTPFALAPFAMARPAPAAPPRVTH